MTDRSLYEEPLYRKTKGSLSVEDWQGIKNVIKETASRTVAEFGCGMSTLLMSRMDIKLTVIEQKPGWAKIVCEELRKEGLPVPEIVIHDNRSENILQDRFFDLVFVDGMDPRNAQYKIAIRISDNVLVHDGHRDHKLISSYISSTGQFKEHWTGQSGCRCRYFRKIKQENENSNHIGPS